MDDNAKGGQTQFWEHFNRDSLCAKIILMLITPLFYNNWISN